MIVIMPQAPEDAVSVVMMNGKKDTRIPYYGGIGDSERFKVISAAESIDFWVQHNNCSKVPQTEFHSDV